MGGIVSGEYPEYSPKKTPCELWLEKRDNVRFREFFQEKKKTHTMVQYS
jgi:hypothetical protein